MATIRKTQKWTFSLTLVVAVTAATLFGGIYGNHLFGAPIQNPELQQRMKEYTDLLAAVAQGGEGAAHVVQVGHAGADDGIPADPDAGQPAGQAEVGCKAEPAWMGDAVAIDEGEVGRAIQHPQGVEQGRQFAEAEQARDVGHARGRWLRVA